ncbi:MAG: hypothetical protein MMC33_001951 [Icmadophila ericetorum]|nr:hypothetical protein [Icmadophila ericetorum]
MSSASYKNGPMDDGLEVPFATSLVPRSYGVSEKMVYSNTTYTTLCSFRFRIFVAFLVIANSLFLGLRYELPELWSTNYGANNRTLGFETILVVSPNADKIPSRLAWRKDGLLKAASYTGFRVQIPKQPKWTGANTSALISKSAELQHGYALSWLGQLNVIREAEKHTTTLILEDDADWDIGLMTQLPPIAEAVRNLTNAEISPEGTRDPPYGMDWDVLWLGHCGDTISPYYGTFLAFPDPTVPPYAIS